MYLHAQAARDEFRWPVSADATIGVSARELWREAARRQNWFAVLVEGSVATGESLIERSSRAIDTLRNGSLGELGKPQFDEDFHAFLGMANFFFTISSLSELQAAGSFEAIDDSELRLTLVNFIETVNTRRQQSELLGESFGPAVMQLLDYVDVTTDFMSGGAILSGAEELMADPLILRTMVKLQLMQVVQRNNLEGFLEELKAMRTTLADLAPAADR